mgnify:CR=1 FL=1
MKEQNKVARINRLVIIGVGLIGGSFAKAVRKSLPVSEVVGYGRNPKNLEMITRIFFSNRRKMINKNFVKLFKNNKSIANELNLDLNLRPEQLSCEMYYKITAKYEKLFG